MRKRVSILLLLLVLAGAVPVQAGEASPLPPETVEQVKTETPEGDEEGWSGVTIFVLVFLFSVLFVGSSATAMNRLGGKRPPPRNTPRPQPSQKKRPQNKDRFRL